MTKMISSFLEEVLVEQLIVSSESKTVHTRTHACACTHSISLGLVNFSSIELFLYLLHNLNIEESPYCIKGQYKTILE